MKFEGLIPKAAEAIRDNSPAILTALSVAGVISTAALTAKATISAHRAYLEASSEFVDPPTVKDMIPVVWKDYIPPALTATATIACVVGANSVSTRRQAAIAAAYSLTENAFREYKDEVAQTISPKKAEEVRAAISAKSTEDHPLVNQTIIVSDGTPLCYDQYSGRYFNASMEDIRAAQNTLNQQIVNEGYASLNDFYHILGIPSSIAGEEAGWTTDNLLEVEFSSVLALDGKPCLAVHYIVGPKKKYYKFG